jgi:hypothetical protein
MGLMEKIKEIEAEMARTQKNKASNSTEGSRCILHVVDDRRRSPAPTLQHRFLVSYSFLYCTSFLLLQATNYHLGTLKAKLAKLRSELFLEQSGGGGGAGGGEGFAVARNGDARVALIGFPSGTVAEEIDRAHRLSLWIVSER